MEQKNDQTLARRTFGAWTRRICFILTVALFATGQVQAQVTGVLYHQKISSTEGGFQGPLTDNDWFGNTAGLGNLDGELAADLAVGAAQDSDNGLYHGAVWVLFLNPDGTVEREQKIDETNGGFDGVLGDWAFFGWATEAIGDVDGDDVVDLAVGATGDTDGGLDAGAVWILFLNPNGTVKASQKISATEGNFGGDLDAYDWFGFSLSALGDMDSDGVPDLAVGSPFDDDGGEDRGAFYVLFLNDDGTVKAHQKVSDTVGGFTGELSDGDTFGLAMALGDLDGDGVVDLSVGAPEDDDGGDHAEDNRGAVWILFMYADGTVKSHQKISATEGGFVGPLVEGDLFGEWATGVGDLNDDGVVDLVVGALLDDGGGIDRGALWVLHLNPDGTVWYSWKISDIEGDFDGDIDNLDWFSFDPSPVGDLNGDGMVDLAVGAPGDDDGGDDRGAVYILFLNPAPVGLGDPETQDPPVAENPPALRSHLVAGVPNPFNPRTTIHFELARSGDATIRIFDVAGRLVRDFELSDRPAGGNTIDWDGRDARGRIAPNGTYLVRLDTVEAQDTMRVTLAK